MHNPFTKHPKSVDETYFEHMCCAFKFHCTLLRLSLYALVHAIFPFLFKTTASDGIKKLNDCMQKRNESTINTYGDDDWATPKSGEKMFEDRSDEWLIDQYNRHRDAKYQIRTIEELKKLQER